MTPVATVRLRSDEGVREEAATGHGPVDAVYRALERIVAIPLSLENYEIRSVGSGKDALGEVTVRMRSASHVVHGRGLSTDVVEASALAYVDVLNKLAAGLGRLQGAVGAAPVATP
jgi:2-isopropylmalate synthase